MLKLVGSERELNALTLIEEFTGVYKQGWQLEEIREIFTRRCIKWEDFCEIKETLFHHFSDVSEEGYGQANLLTYENLSWPQNSP